MVDASYLTDASGFTGWADRLLIPETEAQVSEILAEAVEIGSCIAHVGPAVTLKELRDAAARTGRFYVPDPTEISASNGNGRDCARTGRTAYAACARPGLRLHETPGAGRMAYGTQFGDRPSAERFGSGRTRSGLYRLKARGNATAPWEQLTA